MTSKKKLNVGGVVFDLGHTLMDFQGEWEEIERLGVESLFEFFAKQGVDVSRDMAKAFSLKRHEGHLQADLTLVEYTAERALKETLEHFSLNGNSKEFVLSALEAYFRPELENWRPNKESVAVLKKLKEKGVQVGLISNATHHPFVLNCLQRFGFHDYLDPALSSAAFPVRKPHPDIFHHIAAQWNMAPERIAVVGDQLYFDIYGAHQAGMKGIWFEQITDKAHTFIPETLKDDPRLTPDLTIHALSEILEALA